MKPTRSKLLLRCTNLANFHGEHDRTFYAGVNILRGPNAIGKTELTRGIVAALAGLTTLNGSIQKEPDGTKVVLSAQVEEVTDEGVRLLAKTRARQGTLAAPSTALADQTALTRFLTGNGYVDPDVADKARVKTLFELLPHANTATDADIRTLIGRDEDVAALFPDEAERSALAGRPVLDVLDTVRARANARKTATADDSKKQSGAADAHQATVTRLKASAPQMMPELAEFVSMDEDDCRKELAGAVSASERTSIHADARKAQEDRIERIKDARAKRKKPDPTRSAAAVRTVMAELSGNKDSAQRQQAERDQLTTELARVQQGLDTTLALRAQIDAKLEAAKRADVEEKRALESWLAEEKEINVPVDGPTQQEARAARDEVKVLTERNSSVTAAHKRQADIAAHAVQLVQVEKDRKAAAELSSALKQESKTWEKLAERVDSNLGGVLARKGIPGGLTVSGGRLYATVKDPDGETRVKLFAGDKESCSEGQQTSIMLDLGIAAFPHKAISVEPAWWGSLTPRGQAEFADKCLAAGVMLLTAEPTDDDGLTIAYLPPL